MLTVPPARVITGFVGVGLYSMNFHRELLSSLHMPKFLASVALPYLFRQLLATLLSVRGMML